MLFHNKTYLKFDDYMSPKYAFENIKQYIPLDKTIWEPFYGDGKSGQYLQELGFNVIHDTDDFFKSDKGDIIITNPPFSKIKEIMIRLLEIDKPFILILPASKICTKYMKSFFESSNEKLQIIIPPKRIQFVKKVNGEIPKNYIDKCNFDCFYYCYKMNNPKDIIFL